MRLLSLYVVAMMGGCPAAGLSLGRGSRTGIAGSKDALLQTSSRRRARSSTAPLAAAKKASTPEVVPQGGVTLKSVEGLQEGMKMRQLPNSDLVVTELCLGTMTFGEQVNKETAMSLLDAATGRYGINFIDTAESYPSPAGPSTTGRTEQIVGEWLKGKGKSLRRDSVVISTKVCGFSDQITWCRKDQSVGTRVNRQQVFEAVDAQLKRLGTDYIDLLSINWPDRYVPMYGALDYQYELERQATTYRDQLEIMQELLRSGKIRAFGLSNETPYGVGSFSTTADLLGLPRPSTTQNCYSLLVRNEFESGMQEACSAANGNLGLLAYSPLAGGVLTGKYMDGVKNAPRNSRMRQYVGFMHRYLSPITNEAVMEYAKMADSLSMPLAPIALSFVYSRPFVSSTIIGATSLQQLEDNVMALNVPMSPEMYRLIQGVYRKFVDPSRGVFDVIDPNLEYTDPSKLPWGAKDQDVDPELDALITQRWGAKEKDVDPSPTTPLLTNLSSSSHPATTTQAQQVLIRV